MDTPAGVWQADHVYAEGEWIVDSEGALQQATTGGTSDSTEPTWPGLDNPGTTTDDNSVQWTQQGDNPSAGSGHFVINTATIF